MSRSLFSIFLLFSLVISACVNEDAKIPQNVIPLSEMRPVISELLISEAYIQMHPMRIDSEKIESTRLFDQVIARHHLTQKQLYDNLVYYSTHPEIMNEGYKPLIDSLNALEAHLR
jgi:hypothetical protein